MAADDLGARNPIPRTFDSVFRSVKPKTVPLAYMRALAEAESALNPRAKTGRHFGLFQISPPFLSDVNEREGTSFSHTQMLDPRHNAFVWSRYYEHLIKPILEAEGVSEDWSDIDWARLVTAAHNSGIGAVRRALTKARGANAPLTHASVFTNIGEGKNDAKVLTDKKRRFQRAVAALFQREQRRDAGDAGDERATSPSPAPSDRPAREDATVPAGGGGEAWLLLLILWALSEN